MLSRILSQVIQGHNLTPTIYIFIIVMEIQFLVILFFLFFMLADGPYLQIIEQPKQVRTRLHVENV